GVVVNAPENNVFILQGDGPNVKDVFRDTNGNIVFGRLTEAAGVWTLSFLTDVGGVETPYDFSLLTNLQWFYQELFPVLTDNQVYSKLPDIFGDRLGSGSSASAGLRSGSVPIPIGVKTINASFANLGTNDYAVTPTIINIVDGSPQVLPVTVSAKSGTGFTADWSANTDSANYVLDYLIRDNSAAPTVGEVVFRSGTEAVGSGVKSLAVVFSSDIGSAIYAIRPNLINTTDASPQVQPVTVTNKTSTGFTANWSANTDSANYEIDYIATRNTSGLIAIQSGSETLASGIATKVVSFPAMSTLDYSISPNIVNTTDGSPQILPLTILGRTITSFTAIWPANTDSANYTLDWVIRDNTSDPVVASKNWRSGSPAIGSGVKTLAVVFSSTMGTTNYAVNPTMANSVDGSPQIQEITVTNKTATGFTANWSANTDSANYLLDYVAVEN
ncbi:MAG: hypothetical protein ACXABY_21980, partial [Candidatus Thorarchaeota archaeon]